MQTNKLLTIAEVADITGLGRDAVWRSVQSGRLPGFKTGRGRGVWRVPAAALERLLMGEGEPRQQTGG